VYFTVTVWPEVIGVCKIILSFVVVKHVPTRQSLRLFHLLYRELPFFSRQAAFHLFAENHAHISIICYLSADKSRRPAAVLGLANAAG
jgi:hypothetical protein